MIIESLFGIGIQKKLKLNLTEHNGDVRSIIQLHNGYLASAGGDSKIIIWK